MRYDVVSVYATCMHVMSFEGVKMCISRAISRSACFITIVSIAAWFYYYSEVLRAICPFAPYNVFCSVVILCLRRFHYKTFHLYRAYDAP